MASAIVDPLCAFRSMLAMTDSSPGVRPCETTCARERSQTEAGAEPPSTQRNKNFSAKRVVSRADLCSTRVGRAAMVQIRQPVRHTGAARSSRRGGLRRRRELPRSLELRRGGRVPALDRFCHPSSRAPSAVQFFRPRRLSRRLPVPRPGSSVLIRPECPRQAFACLCQSFILLSFCLQ